MRGLRVGVAMTLAFSVSLAGLAEMAPGADTPQGVIDRMAAGVEAEDFGEIMACLAPEARTEMSMGLYMGATMMVAFAGMGLEMGQAMGEAFAEEGMEAEGGEEAEAELEAAHEEIAALEASYDELMSKYGLPKLADEGQAPEMDPQSLFAGIDQGAFVQDVMAFLERMPDDGEGGGGPGEMKMPATELTDLEVDGDSATGMLGEDEVSFVRLDGRWFIAELPGSSGGDAEEIEVGEGAALE